MQTVTKFLFTILTASFFLILAPTTTHAAMTGSLKVTYPNGGETFKVGDTVTIKWNATENIDSIYLGYSFGPGSLNWIKTSVPNTGSYTWKVNIGNTTNTKIKIDITGYDTGVGSLSDQSDGFFTVNPVATPTPTRTPTITPTRTPIPTKVPTPLPTKAPTIAPTKVITPVPTTKVEQTNIFTITTIILNQYFFFDGSKSTDLTKVDPKKVENFTLDRQDLLYFTFIGIYDLSEESTAKTFQNLDKMVNFEPYYISFEWEFWIIFETPVEINFHDKDKKINETSPVILNGKLLNVSEYEIKTAANGDKKVIVKPEVIKSKVKEGEKIEISVKPSMQVNLDTDKEVKSTSSVFKLEGTVSDATSKVVLELNGEESEPTVDKDGKFNADLKLDSGRNIIKVSAYTSDAKTPYSTVDSVINYTKQEASFSPIWIIGIVLVIGFVGVTGIIAIALGWMFFKK